MNQVQDVTEIQDMLNQRLTEAGYCDIAHFLRDSGVADHADRETVRKCFNDTGRMVSYHKLAVIMKYLGFPPVVIKATLKKAGDTVFYTLLSDDSFAPAPWKASLMERIDALVAHHPVTLEAVQEFIDIMEKITVPPQSDTTPRPVVPDTPTSPSPVPVASVPADDKISFSNQEIDTFYSDLVYQNADLSAVEHDFIVHILKDLSRYGSMPSVLDFTVEPEKALRAFDAYEASAAVSLKTHALNTVRAMVAATGSKSAATIIPGLVHDFWRIPFFRATCTVAASSLVVSPAIINKHLLYRPPIPPIESSWFNIPLQYLAAIPNWRAISNQEQIVWQFVGPLQESSCFVCELAQACMKTREVESSLAEKKMPVPQLAKQGPGLALHRRANNEVILLDPFDKQVSNHNLLLCGMSGSGKTVVLSALLLEMLAEGRRAVVLDCGGSYHHLAKAVGGIYREISPDQPVSLNPFAYSKGLTDCDFVANSLMLLAAHPAPEAPETARTVMKAAVKYVQQHATHEASVEQVIDVLHRCTPLLDELPFASHDAIKPVAERLALALATASKQVAQWMSGKLSADLHPESAPLIVYDFEKMTPLGGTLFPAFFFNFLNVLMNSATPEQITGNVFVIDEAWRCFCSPSDDTTKSNINIMEECYRQVRRHGGSLAIATQSYHDLERWGTLGDIVRCNSVFGIYCQHPDFNTDYARRYFDDQETIRLGMSLQPRPPHYNEILFTTYNTEPEVMRLALNDFQKALCTTRYEEREKFDKGLFKTNSPVLALYNAIR